MWGNKIDSGVSHHGPWHVRALLNRGAFSRGAFPSPASNGLPSSLAALDDERATYPSQTLAARAGQ
jgi:hypothetical protein